EPITHLVWVAVCHLNECPHVLDHYKIFGHQDIATTMRYNHLSPDYLQETVNRGSLIGTGNDQNEVASEDFGEKSKPFN
ncbi:MAG: hypothetical protein KC643_33245, partial [Nitrospira sp.]|nr:hypothetical protein [Nitrospira sp.]